MIDLVIIIFIGFIGGYIANKCKIPAGFMIGSLLMAAIYNICIKDVYIPTYFKFATQIATGTFLGTNFYKKDLRSLKLVLLPGIFMVLFMIAFSLGMSYIISHFFGMDYVTALFAVSPGGIMDMSLLAFEFKANTSQVALLQLIRLISVIIFVPLITKKVYFKFNEQKEKYKEKIYAKKENIEKEDRKNIKKIEGQINFLKTIVIGIVGGYLGYKLKIPAGTMSFSMLLVAIFNVRTSKAYMPLSLRKFIQTIGGTLIGSRVSVSDIMSIKYLIFPIIIIIFGFVLMSVVIGFILYKTTKFSITTALLSAAPGGMSDIALIAQDLGANSNEVAMMQFLRASCIIGIYPLVIKFIFS